MNLSKIKPGTEIFLDANIIIYHYTGISEESSQLLQKCEKGELSGVTGISIILEVLHRLMLIEAVNKKLIAPPKLIEKIEKNPDIVKSLNEYFYNTMLIFDMGIRVLSTTRDVISESHFIRNRYGLLVNDSLIIAHMQQEGIIYLASNDNTFSRIEWLTLLKPTDVAI